MINEKANIEAQLEKDKLLAKISADRMAFEQTQTKTFEQAQLKHKQLLAQEEAIKHCQY